MIFTSRHYVQKLDWGHRVRPIAAAISITVDHSLSHRPNVERKTVYAIQTPKTEAGIRTIPLFPEVKEAFIMEYEIQKCLGFCKHEIDGYSGFVFSSSEGTVYAPESINQALYRIREAYNIEETALAKKEKREPVLLPKFSCHILRHTFCTRLCEVESNIKVIQSIMGHKDISTTLDIYADCTDEKKKEVLNNLDGKLIINKEDMSLTRSYMDIFIQRY